jgi:hypothetical protein
MVFNLVAESAADEVPEKRPTAKVGSGFDLKLGPIY